MLVHWATTYFQVTVINPVDLWPRLIKLKQHEVKELHVESHWAVSLLPIWQCCVCPLSHTYVWSTLTGAQVKWVQLEQFIEYSRHRTHSHRLSLQWSCHRVAEWRKRRRPNQRKRKGYQPRNGWTRTRANERAEFLEEWPADICSDSETERGSDIELRLWWTCPRRPNHTEK